MGKQDAVPDAWDDDWESQIDQTKEDVASKAAESVSIPKSERLARHAESNKKLWESADKPETFHFLETREKVPLKTEFKPTLQVLSRKPIAKSVISGQAVSGLSLDDDDDDDQANKKNEPSPEELRLKAQKEREEKQRKYDAARERLFGSPVSTVATESPTSRAETPPLGGSDPKASRGKGRIKGGRDSHSSPNRQNPRPGKAPKELMKRAPPDGRQLYDPDESTGNNPVRERTIDRFRDHRPEVPTRQPTGPVEHSKGFRTAM